MREREGGEMERTREPRRGIMAATNGGLSRRRQRNSFPRDSPDDDGGMEMHETARLRDRGSKKDRDRDRSSRSKRRRGERMLHGSNRDEGDDSSEESVDEEEDDEEDDAAVAVRLLPPPPPPPPPPNPAPSSLQQNHQHRKSFPPKILRVPPWKAADEIGVPIPKKARSASAKRPHECWVSGGGGGGAEQIQRPPSTSPSGLSLASTAQISSTSNVSIRKKMKPISGTKQRSPKMSKSSLMQEEIEIEVAEVLYKMTRQIPPMQEANQVDSQDAKGSSNEAKRRIPSPNSVSPPPTSQISVLPPSSLSSNAPLSATAPKRKHPRTVNFEDECPVTLALQRTSLSSAAAKMGTESPLQSGTGSLKSENTAVSLYSENGVGSTGLGASMAIAEPPNVEKEFGKPENNSVPELKVLPTAADGGDRVEIQEDAASPKNPTLPTDWAVGLDESITLKGSPGAGSQVSDNRRREKFRFDLMALPPGKSSPERDSSFDLAADHNSVGREIELVSKLDNGKRGEEATKMARQNAGENSMKDKKTEMLIPEEWDSKNPMSMEKTLDLEKFDKHQLQKQQSRDSRMEPIPENAPPASLPMPMHAGWPGSFPPFGFVGQVPSLQAVVPMDVAAGSSSTLQSPHNFLSPPVRPKRCATHCYIARNIYFQERIARMNHPFWPATTSTAAMFGAKAMNLNAVPPPESAFLINPLQGSYPARSLGSLQDNKPPPFTAALAGHHHPEKEKISTGTTNFMEGVQRKQVIVQQTPLLPGSANNMLGPAFIFPLHQQQAVAAAAATAVRSGAAKPAPGVGNAAPSSISAVASSGAGVPVAALNFGYAPITPNDAQYLAILQNSAYPFPIPAHVGGSPPYRGAPPPQAIPFFNGSFYSPQMLQQLQLQQQQLATQQPAHAPQKHQNTSTSSSSSSSQKHPQKPHRGSGGGTGDAGASPRSFPAVKQRPQLQAHQARQLESETGCGDSPSSAGSMVSQAQKSIYGHNSAIPIHPPSRALKSTAAAALGSGGGQSEKQESAQAFSMPFASFNTGATPSALDFTSVVQNQALYQSLPEAARHGYQISTVAAATAAMASAVQHKKVHLQPREDGKYAGAMNANMTLEASSKTRVASGSQHSLAFSRPDNNELPISFRELNSIPPTANGSRASDPSCSTGAVAPTASANTPNSQQIQQQQRQLQQQQLASSRTKTSASNINTGVCSDRHPAGSAVNKFPQTMAGFPQGIMQGGSPTQSPQWKAVSMKNHLQQQRGAAEQTPLTPSHQAQISFGTNPFNAAHQPAGGTSNVSTSSAGVVAASTAAVGSPLSSVSKITGTSSRAPTSGKLGPPATALPLTQQSSSKITVSCSSLNSSPNRNAPPTLGHSHFTPVTNSSTGQQLPQLQPQYQRTQKQQQQILQKQPQVFFPNAAYMQSQPLHSSAAAAAAAGFYQRRQPEQHPQQQSSHPVPNGMLVLCSSALPLSGSPTTSDAAATKAVCSAAANSMKGLPPAGLIHAAHLAAAAQSASIAAFPYMSMPPLSVKPVAADQTATTGNDNLNACWQPDKR